MMVATARSLSASRGQSYHLRRRLAAMGSLAAFTTAAAAFLVDPQQQRQPAISSGSKALWNRIRSEGSPASSTLWSKLSAGTSRDDIDEHREQSIDAPLVTDLTEGLLRKRFRVGDSYVWLYKDVDGNPTSWEKYTVTRIEDDKKEGPAGGDSDGQNSPRSFVVTIEMSTKFNKGEDYQTHHRIRANLTEHLMKSSESKDGWIIGFEFFERSSISADGVWKPFGKGDNVQAFEEKFDVFSMMASVVAKDAIPPPKATKGGVGVPTEDPRDECLIPWTTLRKTLCEKKGWERSRPASVTTRTTDADGVRKTVDDGSLTNSCQPATRLTCTQRHGYTEAWYGPSDHETLSGIALYKEFPSSKHSFSLIERITTRDDSNVTDAIEVIVSVGG